MRKQGRQTDTALGLQDTLPHIATLDRRRLSAPLFGSVMSLPACAKGEIDG